MEEYQQRALAADIRGGRLTARQAEKLAKTYKTGRRDGASSANSPSVTSDPDLKRARLERALAERMGTPVTIRYDASGRGQVMIDFANPQSVE